MALTTVLLSSSTKDLPRLELTEEALPLLEAREKINPLTLESNLSDRQVVVSEESSLPVFEKTLTIPELENIAFSSKSDNLRDGAISLAAFAGIAAVLGFVNPLFFIAALVLAIGAIICGVESRSASSEAEEAKSQLRPIYQDMLLEEETPSQEAEIAKLLRGETVTIEERGRFTPNQFPTMMERNSDGALRAFSSYIPGQFPYPYKVPGIRVKEGESAPDAIFAFFAKQAVGLDNPELVQKFLGLEGNWIQNRARHMCGFLKLLGDGNNPINPHIAMGIAMQNTEVAFDVIPLKTGRIPFISTSSMGDSPVMYRIRGDEVGLYSVEDFVKADRQPVMRFTTERTVTVFPPDLAGNVRYTINRTFTRI